ncbi:unnamed protein product [Ophioblennius macclurei]
MCLWKLRGILVFLSILRHTNGQFIHGISVRPSWGGLSLHNRLRDRSFLQLVKVTTPTVSSEPRFTLLAPDLLRTDSQENIFLQAEDMSSPVTISISIQDFSKTTTLLEDSATLNQENCFHTLKTIQLPSDKLNRDEKKNKFVYLKVNFEGFHVEERVLMVTFHSGYIFVQTDKPVYNPGDTVRLRAFVSSSTFKAFDSSITIDVQNPDGVVVKQISRVRATDGIFREPFPLSEIVSEGLWVVTAKFDHWQQNTFTSQFEVKKYVLPAFNVTMTPTTSFLSLDDKELEVEISARYLYGETVQGIAYVVFGVKINKDMIRLPAVKQMSQLDGGVVKLSMDELKEVYPNIRSLVGHSVYVKASVLTKTGSDLVEAEKTGIKIVESPYVVSFKDTPKYFKPGLPLDFTVQVNHHDGSPAHNVMVKLTMLNEPLIIASGSTRASVNMPSDQRSQIIIAKTTQAGLRPEQQARQQITVQPYSTFNKQQQNYLSISTGANSVSVGDTLSVTLSVVTADQTHKEFIKHITYMVLSKGKILTAKQLDVSGQVVTSVVLSVTADMTPSFRFVAFYSIPWARQEEVVSDSVWIDVVDSCIGGLTVGSADDIPREHTPGKTIRFKIRGDPGSKVSMVAVDNAVYLLSRDRLTQKKVWDVVERGDMGCTRGGGRDASGVFSDAGVLYSSSRGFKTGTRQALECPGNSRRRRSPGQVQHKVQLENHYKEKLLRRCCKDGLRAIPMPYSCTRRSLYITEGWECIRAFRYCCATYRGEVFDTEVPTTPPPTTTAPLTTTARPFFRVVPRRGKMEISRYSLDTPRLHTTALHRSPSSPGLPGPPGTDGRMTYTDANKMAEEELLMLREVVREEEDEDEEWDYLDEADVYLRSKFFESWLWMDFDLPKEPDFDGKASLLVSNVLPDSITEWGFLAVSASPDTGFCVAEPYNVKAWKHFFVDLKLPYSVARNEQVEIKAVIHNYGDQDLHVRVVLMKTEDMCSVAFKDRHMQEVTVAAGSSVAVLYTIVPLVVGKLPLEVTVLDRDTMGGDRVQKFLRVVLDGVQKTKVWSSVLNPSAEGGTQMVRVARVHLESVVPNSVPETFMNVRGNVLADSIDNSISGDSLGALIRMPGGCVEQNLATVTLPLIATLYLERSDGWEGVGVERKAEAIRYIRKGYEKQLAYKMSGGAYPPYRGQGASTWITAYVVKVFSMAHPIIGVSKKELCDPLDYLLKNKYRSAQGRFVEDNPVYSTTMTGGLQGDDPEMTLTAFVLIALAEAKQAGFQCYGSLMNPERVIHRIVSYLKKAVLRPGRRPYTVAIVSYALSLTDSRRFNPTKFLLAAAAGGSSHWPDGENALFTLEATGYALLTLVKMGQMEEAAAAFRWLNSQRRRGGGFGSTQSTMVVLQALSEYLIHQLPPKDLNLDVDVKMAGRSEIRYHFNPDTAYVARSFRLPLNEGFDVEARGNGQGILEVVTYYNQLHEVDEKQPCEHFDLSVVIEQSSETPPADMEKSYQLTIKARALGPRDVRMVVLDISLPTGFTPENSDLEMLSNSVDRYISNFQIVDNLSDRGSLIIHLFKVSHKEPEILIFRLQQRFKVGLLQPSSVTVYEYYNPDHRCSRTYMPCEDKEELSRICKDNVCRCTQGDCCITRVDHQDFTPQERVMFACNGLHHVFQVKVLNVNQSYYERYEMEITQVIKLGVESGVEVGQQRVFMSHRGCRDQLSLEPGSQYLIIGPKEDSWTIEADSHRNVYILGKDTWVERWPSSAECSTSAGLQAKCLGLQEAAHQLSVNGCRL